MSEAIKCPYCDGDAQLVWGDRIYPRRRDLFAAQFYLCIPCDAYCGCHPGSTRPLGRLANAELRKAKMEAHAAFDPTWRGHRSRSGAYAWLAEQLGIERKDCHIGMFDVEMCRKVVEVCTDTNAA
jgi:hypothetical protein